MRFRHPGILPGVQRLSGADLTVRFKRVDQEARGHVIAISQGRGWENASRCCLLNNVFGSVRDTCVE